MIRLGIVTATRAEYGILKPLIYELRKYESDSIHVDLIVTGTHLSGDYGMTVDEIIADDVRIDHQISIPVMSGSPIDISYDQSITLTEFTKHFTHVKYDSVYILGDRYEMLMVAIAAMNTHTPIIHLCGGDTTEGAIDEAIRHSITKMSYLHFPTNEESRRRIIQLGESPDRVYNVGDTAIDNIFNMELYHVDEVLEDLGATSWKNYHGNLKDIRYALCTYHPVTLDEDNIEDMMCDFLNAIKDRSDIEFIVTKSNSDIGGNRINKILDDSEICIDNMHVYASLGVRRYLSVMSGALFVMGNSSSGLYEAPVMHIPTVNIGDRQKGRLRCESVIDCKPDRDSILDAIKKACSDEFTEKCKNVISPYGDGHAAEKIAKISIDTVKNGINLKKRFYDLDKYRA